MRQQLSARVRALLERAAVLLEEAGSHNGRPLPGRLRYRLLQAARAIERALEPDDGE